MKKTYRMFSTLCMMGVVAFLASSCNKNEEKPTVSIGLPAPFEEVIADDGGEKLYVDFNNGSAYKWNANDRVMIYNLDATDGTKTQKAIYSTGTEAEGQLSAMFNGADLGVKKDHYFVFFPVEKLVNDALDQNNYQTFQVPESQDYTLVDGNPTVDKTSLAAACEINTINTPFTLQHIFGVCRLRLKGTMTIKKIELTDPHHGLAGTLGMKLHEVNMAKFQNLMDNYTLVQDGQEGMNPAFVTAWNAYRQQLNYTSQASSHTITLNCVTPDTPNGVQLQGTTTATPFYIAVRPGAFIDGFTITVYDMNDNPTVINNYVNPKTSYRIRAGYITGFAPNGVVLN